MADGENVLAHPRRVPARGQDHRHDAVTFHLALGALQLDERQVGVLVDGRYDGPIWRERGVGFGVF